MDAITDLSAAQAAVGVARNALNALREAEFWRFAGGDMLELAVDVEQLDRVLFCTQVNIAGEIDTQRVASDHGAVSAAALLRQTLAISGADAQNRVNTARATQPRDGISGEEIPPALPLLGEALAAGAIGAEQARTVVASMRKLPAHVDAVTRASCEKYLVENGQFLEPKPFAEFARAVVNTCTPDGTPPDDDCADKVELSLGVRNPGTGMTRFHGQLDDIGVELMSQAIDGLSKPQPATDGGALSDDGTDRTGGGRVPDPRSATCRRGQALMEVLRRFLNAGIAPSQGGERPHVTVTISLEDLMKPSGGVGYLDFGGPISAGIARMLACDAAIIPAVLNSTSQVLDVGRASRLFPTAIRRAIELRDKGCTFPGCDRPAAWTDCHHIVHWTHNGPSSYENGCLLCPKHHSEIHRGHWEVRMAADGQPEFIPPEWLDKQRRPRRNMSHRIPELVRL